MNVVLDNLSTFASGIKTTLALSVFAYSIALVLGAIVATMRVGPMRLLRVLGAVYVETFMSVPLLVWALMFFFGFPKLGITFGQFASALVVLSTWTAALVAEAVRSGINTVPPGQAEAARAIGLRFSQVIGEVVMPQAVRSMIGPLGSVFLALVRNTAAVALAMSVDDIMFRADRLNTDTARPIAVFLGAMVAYLIITLPGTVVVNRLQHRWAIKR